MSIRRRLSREVPGLNTASLPDLIFTVLFFFMIVTHMRETTLKVQYRTPEGTQLTRLVKKSSVIHIYIGPAAAPSAHPSGVGADSKAQAPAPAEFHIQVNDRLTDADGVADLVAQERRMMSPEDARSMTVSIKADRRTPMAVITQVKLALRQAGALRISYSASERAKGKR